MRLLSLLIVLTCSLSATTADRTRTEWEEGINSLLFALTESRNDNNMTAFADCFTEDFQGFRPGTDGVSTVIDLERIKESVHYKLVNVRWFCGDGAVVEFTMLSTTKDVQDLKQYLGLVIDEEGTLKISTAEMNYTY